MGISTFLLAWVMVNGFPIASFETCAEAEAEAAELQHHVPDLQVRAECNTERVAKPDVKADADPCPPADRVGERKDRQNANRHRHLSRHPVQ